jgi:hypothetical protein
MDVLVCTASGSPNNQQADLFNTDQGDKLGFMTNVGGVTSYKG